MPYSRYFKKGQKIILRALDPGTQTGRFESLTVYLEALNRDFLDFTLPYRNRKEEQYPFVPGMPFEILSDSMGLGVSITGRFRERVGDQLIRMEANHDLQVFKRRLFGRSDLKIGLRFTRGQGSLRSFREQWEKNIRILEKNGNLSQLPAFPRCRVTLSASGIRFSVALTPLPRHLSLSVFYLLPSPHPSTLLTP
ncbi:MAG: hypothetical protein P8Z70_05155 [Desulfuromonadales bacterium]